VFYYTPKTTSFGTDWPITTIKNYIVQGTGADLVMIARISLYNRMKAAGFKSKLVATVHDSIVVDCPEDEWEAVAKVALQSVRDVPANFERMFGKKFNLQLNAEVLYSKTLGNMQEWVDK
jgi:DNA polymerase I-like protein with 3'-5' exonuclease and polymerase domains